MIDFARLVTDLRGHFGTVAQVSRKLGYGNPDMLRHLERGEIADPRFSLGMNLCDLYRKVIGDELPVVGGGQQRRLL